MLWNGGRLLLRGQNAPDDVLYASSRLYVYY